VIKARVLAHPACPETPSWRCATRGPPRALRAAHHQRQPLARLQWIPRGTERTDGTLGRTRLVSGNVRRGTLWETWTGRVAFVHRRRQRPGRAPRVQLAKEGAEIIGIDALVASRRALSTGDKADLDESRRADSEPRAARRSCPRPTFRDLRASPPRSKRCGSLGRLDVIVAKRGILLPRRGTRRSERTLAGT